MLSKFLLGGLFIALFEVAGGGPAGAPTGGSPSPAPSPAAPGASGTPAAASGSPALPAAVASGSAPQPADQLRTAYDNVSKQYEPWKTFGDADPAQVHQIWRQHQNAVNEGRTIAREYGYSDVQFDNAVKELGLPKVIAYLQQQRATSRPDPVAALRREFSDMLNPIIQDRNYQQGVQQFKAFENHTMPLVQAKFGGAEALKDHPGLAADLFDYASAMMAQDEKIVEGVKKGDMSGVAKYVDLAYTRLIKSFQMYGEFMQKRGADPKPGGEPAPAPANGSKRPSLKDIIYGNANAIAAIPSMRN